MTHNLPAPTEEPISKSHIQAAPGSKIQVGTLEIRVRDDGSLDITALRSLLALAPVAGNRVTVKALDFGEDF